MIKSFRIFLVIPACLLALSQAQAQMQPQTQGSVPIYKITVVARTIPAISYRTLSGSTQIGFQGTTLMPNARGKARVTSRRTATRIQAQFNNMASPSSFGPEYLTYVLWAISPDGRPANVAEIVPHNGKAQIDVTVNFQAFGLIITAEPYFAVTRPSNVVVMQNYVTKNTVGKVEEVKAKAELLQRGQYMAHAKPGEAQPFTMNSKTPLALYEAQNAVRIARWAGAQQYATGTFSKAKQLLTQAEDYQARKAGKKPVIMTSREAVQTAEDARVIALRQERMQAQEQERQAAAERTAEARKKAEQEAVARANAAAAQAAAEAGREKAQAQAERQRLAAEEARARAQQAQMAAQQAQTAAQQAENQRLAMRAKLLNQLNSILQTRQTSNGLVVTMSHVLFNTGKYTLGQGTRETLAKLAGVLLAYPGLTIRVNGYTDNTGSEGINQTLSQQRADAVRDFLTQQGIPSASITARGLGEANPVAPNDTAEGRALNRRVEIVISGEAIGIPVSPVAG
jgi:outer membrane protein OmpA-like peptidoglycan-associated protein